MAARPATPASPPAPEPIVMAWSGGKDSALALEVLRADPALRVEALLTTVTGPYERISMHGVRRSLLAAQARAIGLPLIEARIPVGATNAVYEASFAAALAPLRERGLRRVAFGDLFLADIRQYRERQLAALGMEGVFPVWGRETRALAHDCIARGYRAILVCVDPSKLDASFAGRLYDEDLLRDLPAAVDPCGENGEFHTFVFDGPLLRAPVPIQTGVVVTRGGFVFCDLELPAGSEAIGPR